MIELNSEREMAKTNLERVKKYRLTEKYKEGSAARGRNCRQKYREFMWSHLKGKACVDCGEPDPVVLQFDHEDRATKILAVCEMVNRQYGFARIAAEILKCVVRCANCHTRKTAEQFGWCEAKRFLAS